MATNSRRRGNSSRNSSRNRPGNSSNNSSRSRGSSAIRGANGGSRGTVRRSTETKASFKTTEFIAYVLAVVGVLIASYVVKTNDHHADYFRADKAWFYIVLLTLGYMVSRGLAKSGSREFYDDNPDRYDGNDRNDRNDYDDRHNDHDGDDARSNDLS